MSSNKATPYNPSKTVPPAGGGGKYSNLCAWNRDVAEFVECSPSTPKVLDSIPGLYKPGTVVQACNPSTATVGTGAGGIGAHGDSWLNNAFKARLSQKTLSQKKRAMSFK